jgi:hypothetical protein
VAPGKITKRSVDALLPRTREVFLWDDEPPGSGLKINPAGKRSHVYQYRMGCRERRPRGGLLEDAEALGQRPAHDKKPSDLPVGG